MKKYLLFMLLLCGCVYSARQKAANKMVESYVRIMLDNPHYLESVSFTEIHKKRYTTALDSSLDNAGMKGNDYNKMQKFADSESYQRPDKEVQNINDMDNIKRGKLDYYELIYTFRIDSGGHKKLKRYRFELDSANNVLHAQDITFTRQKMDYQ